MNIFEKLVHVFLVMPFQVVGFIYGIIKRSFKDGDMKSAEYRRIENLKSLEDENNV